MGVARYLSFVEEATFGTPVLIGGETVDPESAELDPSGDAVLIWEGASRLDRIVGAGNYMSEGSITTYFDNAAFPWFLKWMLGGYEVTGTGPYMHRFYPQQDTLMQSFTARVGKDVFEHVFSGCTIGSMSLELDNNFLTASLDILGGKDSKGTLQTDPTFTEGLVYAPCTVTLERNSIDRSAYVRSFSLTIETGADNEQGITIGSRFPRRSFRGSFMVELEATLSFFDTSDLEAFWGSTNGPLDCDIDEHDLIIHLGSDADIMIPRAVYTGITQPLAGRDAIEQTATIRGLVTLAGAGPIEFNITNDKATYTVA